MTKVRDRSKSIVKSRKDPGRRRHLLSPASVSFDRRSHMEPLEDRTLLSFGVTTGVAPTGQPTYVIDNGGNVKFSIIRGGSTTSTLHLGDMSSLQYKGKELLASYADASRYSHYEQGLGSGATITTATGGAAGSRWILVTCDDSGESSGGVIQYYAVRENDNNLYLLSLPTDVNNGAGEGRYIAYLSRSVFTAPEAPSDNIGSTGAIEGSDVFGHPDGTTTSKFYNMGRRMIDNVYHGLTGTSGGTAVGAWMFMGNREHSASGPFFKDIDFQSSASQVEIYNCLFTGHDQTEPFRQGLHIYALQLTGGTKPTAPDYSWLENVKGPGGNLLISGLIPAAQRGALTGTVSGMVAGHQTVVGLSNAAAQYWTYADVATGAYTIGGIQPGTYIETLYDDELEVGRKAVTITAGQTATANIVNAFYTPPNPIFRIGTWDGTPIGFLNSEIADAASGARKIEIMHPSDVRMKDWNSTPNFVVGVNTDSQWPLAEFKDVNNQQRITFNLTSNQVQNLTLRIGITWAFSGGRPRVTVNAGQSYAWTSAIPTASKDLNERGITRGTWRGVNQLYTYNIPASALRAGANTIDLPVVSGSSGAGFLSPNVVFDSIDLVPTTVASPPAIASVTIIPGNATVGANRAQTFTAVARDASGKVIAANIDWSAARGVIDANGHYVAPAAGGTDTITATATITRTPGYTTTGSSTTSIDSSISASGSTTVNVDATPPTVLAATFSPGPSQSIAIVFSDDVSASLSADDLLVQAVPGGAAFGIGSVAWDPATRTATFRPASVLPDGNYRATLHAAGVTDAPGNPLAADYALDFYVLIGDANRDRAVDFSDLVTLAQNYNFLTDGSATWAQGDFNGDGEVDFNDLVLLAQRYNTSLAISAAPLIAAGSTAPATATSPTHATARAVFSSKPVIRAQPHEPAHAKFGR